MKDTPLSKADRLAIGGAVAPAVRQQAEGPARAVTVVDKDGRPVRKTTAVEVTKAVLARSDIEFSVQDGKRPKWVKCETCGAPVRANKKGRIRVVCRGGTYKCACGKPIDPNNFSGKCGRGKSCGMCEWACAQQRGRTQARWEGKRVVYLCACGARKQRTALRCRACWKVALREAA